jgi:hypothetical protein
LVRSNPNGAGIRARVEVWGRAGTGLVFAFVFFSTIAIIRSICLQTLDFLPILIQAINYGILPYKGGLNLMRMIIRMYKNLPFLLPF